jgi:Tfp pilus assembly protein PilV
MFTDQRSKSSQRWLTRRAVSRHPVARSGGYGDSGLTLIEVVVAFTVLMIALIPLSYLFTSSLISAGQSTNQQTALSIAERWMETLSNATPPVNAVSGAVIVDTSEPPAGPAPTAATPATVSSSSNGRALDAVTTINVNSTSTFFSPTAGAQTAYVITGTAPNTTSNQITYTSMTATSLTCPSTCSTATTTMATGNQVTQTEISTPTESRGGTTYSLTAEYDWATVQNVGVVSTTIASTSVGQSLPQSTIYLASVANLLPATTSSPQTLKVPTSKGIQSVSYTGISTSPVAITGVTGGTGNLASGTATQTPAPNLCTSGTPQLLKLTVSVSWGPNANTNEVQDSEMINYPPSGVQTLGFIALQFTGDSTATDAQGDPWSERVTAVPVTISGPENLTIYPDQNGCAFAQVLPGNYTVSVANATNGTPAGTSYGTPSFVANAAGTYTSSVWSPPASEPQGGTPSIPVSIGSVTRIDTSYAANYPSYDQGATVNFSYPSSTAVEDGVTCPGAAQVSCITSGESAGTGGAEVTWDNSSTGSWSPVTLPTAAGLTRQTSVACAGTTACISVGYGTSGAVILRGSTGASPSVTLDTLPTLTGGATITNLSQVVCPSSTQCVAIGTTSTGSAVALSGTIGSTSGGCTVGSDCWTADTLPSNVTALSGLQCPSTATGCLAVATTTTASSPVIVSGPIAVGAWSTGTFTGVTVSALTQVTCPNTTSCLAIGTGKIGSATAATPVVLSGVVTGGTGIGSTGSSVAWTADTYNPTTTTVTSLSSIICPVTGTTPKCLIAGVGTSASTTGALFLYGAPAGPLAAEFPEVSTTPISSITQVTCPSAAQCIAIGLSSAPVVPVIFTGTINSTPSTSDTWTSHTVPSPGSPVTSLNQVTCQTASNCLIMATGNTSSGSPAGFLFATSNGTSWSNVTIPSTDSMLYFDGMACTSVSSGTCAAVGATATGAVVLTSTSGPTGGWSDVTPAGLAGNYPTGIPIEIDNSSLSPSTYVTAVEPGASPDVTTLPVLFPFQAGYSMWAGDCQAEVNSYNVAQAATIPGGISGTTSGMSSPVIPLGLFSLQVTHKTGANIGLADSGAAVNLTNNTGGSCGADSYTLPPTGADGLSRTAVPYGSYTLYIAGSSVGAVVISGNSASFTPTGGSATTYILPTPVGVSV